jgi:alkylhydroperoxidase/carboxymuconolactone decarboxylase family protein YurZ
MAKTPQTKTMLNDEHVNTHHDRTEQILSEVLQKRGFIPKPLKIMAKRPNIVETFMAYRNQVTESGPLSQRERALVGLASVIAVKSANCIPMWANQARDVGVSEEEIVQTMLITSVTSGMSPLQVAYGALKEKEAK